jgi:hypothetical protein
LGKDHPYATKKTPTFKKKGSFFTTPTLLKNTFAARPKARAAQTILVNRLNKTVCAQKKTNQNKNLSSETEGSGLHARNAL